MPKRETRRGRGLCVCLSVRRSRRPANLLPTSPMRTRPAVNSALPGIATDRSCPQAVILCAPIVLTASRAGASNSWSRKPRITTSAPSKSPCRPASDPSVAGSSIPEQAWVCPARRALLPLWISTAAKEAECNYVDYTYADNDGYFSFIPAYDGALEAGDYMVFARAFEYESSEGIAVPAVAEDEDREIGDIPLTPYPIQLTMVRSCPNLPATGGLCRYRVRVTNRSDKQVVGTAWSIVSGTTGTLLGSTVFQTGNPIPMVLRPGATRMVEFRFRVPSTVLEEGYFCATTRFGKGLAQPFFKTLAIRISVSRGMRRVSRPYPKMRPSRCFGGRTGSLRNRGS
jgi:hypothetical protein